MADHPGVRDAIDRLDSWGVQFVAPRVEEGKAKLATEDAIALETARAVDDRPLTGRHVVVTSGATHEPVDPLRTLSNRSSGKTGQAIARALYVRGADVTLLHEAGDVPYATVQQVETADEMVGAAIEAASDAEALVSAAAIADYTVEPAPEKIPSGEDLHLDLQPTPKLLDTVRDHHPDLVLVGFKAETGGDDKALAAAARDLLHRVGCAFVVANDAAVMGTDETRVLVVDADDASPFRGSKAELGFEVADRLAATLAG